MENVAPDSAGATFSISSGEPDAREDGKRRASDPASDVFHLAAPPESAAEHSERSAVRVAVRGSASPGGSGQGDSTDHATAHPSGSALGEHRGMHHRIPLPSSLGATFTLREAQAAGLGRARTDARDLQRPFRGVRSSDVPETFAAVVACGSRRLKPRQRFVGVTAARMWGLPHPRRWKQGEILILDDSFEHGNCVRVS